MNKEKELLELLSVDLQTKAKTLIEIIANCEGLDAKKDKRSLAVQFYKTQSNAANRLGIPDYLKFLNEQERYISDMNRRLVDLEGQNGTLSSEIARLNGQLLEYKAFHDRIMKVVSDKSKD
jgi:hypothetical protein